MELNSSVAEQIQVKTSSEADDKQMTSEDVYMNVNIPPPPLSPSQDNIHGVAKQTQVTYTCKRTKSQEKNTKACGQIGVVVRLQRVWNDDGAPLAGQRS